MMVKIEVCNAEFLGEDLVVLTKVEVDGETVYLDSDGEKVTVVKLKRQEDTYVELENGLWLKSYGDGRFSNVDDENENWAEVCENEYDEEGNLEGGFLEGYTRV